MTGKDLWEQYQHYTKDFTEHARTLGFGAAGVCWLFKTDDFKFPGLIYLALFFVVIYFLCDVLQSIIAALTLRFFTEREERKLWLATGSIEGEIKKPRWVDAPAFVLFCFKALFLACGFMFIGCELLRRLVS